MAKPAVTRKRPRRQAASETPFSIEVGTPVELQGDQGDGTDVVAEVDVDPADGIEDPYVEVRRANDAMAASGNDFYRNLVDEIDPATLARLSTRLAQDIETARTSRQSWTDDLARGIERCGITAQRRSGSEPFRGASVVIHPTMTMAAIDLEARTSKELLPANGPVKTKVAGKATQQKLEKAERVRRFMNWQLTTQIEEYRRESEKLLMMIGFEGSSFKKFWYDPVLQRPACMYVENARMIIPYSTRSLQTVPMFAQEMPYHETDVDDFVRSGAWAKHQLAEPGVHDKSTVQEQLDKTEGRDDPAFDDTSGDLIYYEIHTRCDIPGITDARTPIMDAPEDEDIDDSSGDLEIEGEDIGEDAPALPIPFDEDEEGPDDGDRNPGQEWLIVMAAESNKIVSVRRNWSQNDPLQRRRRVFTHYRLFPWMGFYGLGFLHFIGRLADAATGSLRQLMDSAAISNMPGGVYLKGTRTKTGTIEFRPMEWLELDAPFAQGDVRRVMTPFPANGPSSIMFELLKFLVQTSRDFVSVATQQISEANANMPVGTTLALIEEGSRVYSAIHARLHDDLKEELKLLHEMNRETLNDQTLKEVFGDPDISVADFDEQVDVIPVSDPNIFSQVQRSVQSQVALELVKNAQADGVEVNKRFAYTSLAKSLNLPDIEILFPEKPQPIAADMMAEHVVILKGGDIMVAEEQDHMAHMQGHMMLLSLPSYASTENGSKLVSHVMEHAATLAALPFRQMWQKVLATAQQRNPLAFADGEQPQMPMPLQNMATQAGLEIMGQLTPMLQQIFEPTDAASKLANAEMAKAEAKVYEVKERLKADEVRLGFDREKVAVEKMADIEIVREKTDAMMEQLRLKTQLELEVIRADLEAKTSELMTQAQLARERNASQERIASAQIAGHVQ